MAPFVRQDEQLAPACPCKEPVYICRDIRWCVPSWWGTNVQPACREIFRVLEELSVGTIGSINEASGERTQPVKLFDLSFLAHDRGKETLLRILSGRRLNRKTMWFFLQSA